VWLDTEREMLPVRVRIADDRGRVIDQVIEFNAS
jgi:negative regulator of sigma E activity